MARAETLESRVARLEEAQNNFKEDRLESRTEARADRADILAEIKSIAADVRKLDQSVQSANSILTALSLEDCGKRLTDHDGRLDKLEGTVLTDDFKQSTTRLSRLEESQKETEQTIGRWQKWMGNGITFIGKLILVLAGGGTVFGGIAALAAKFVLHFTH